MVTWSSNLHALSDKASQRYMSQVGNSWKQRKSSSLTLKSSAKPLPETEIIERLTNNLPYTRQAKVDSKVKTAALLGVSRSRERERTLKILLRARPRDQLLGHRPYLCTRLRWTIKRIQLMIRY